MFQNETFCLDITWSLYVPTEFYLTINKSETTYISRAYVNLDNELNWNTRLEENLKLNGNFTITVKYKSKGGIKDARFCSTTGN